MNDIINHPEHYTTGRVDCLQLMLDTQGVEAVKHFCICNSIKYLYRHNKKNGDEDIRKASFYLNKYIELIDKESK